MIKDVQDGELLLETDAQIDADQQSSFDDFRGAASSGNAELTLRVYRIPTDERGNTITNAKNIFLFAAPVDRYSLDEIADAVQRDYMLPGERLMTVRLMVSQKGARGVRFNSVFVVQRKNEPANQSNNSQDSTSILAAVQKMMADSQARSDALLREIMANRNQAPATDPTQTAIAMVAAMSGMIGQLTKSVGPAAAATPVSGLMEMVTAMKAMRELSDDFGGGGNSGSDDSALGIIRAIGPMAQPLITAMANNVNQKPVPQRVVKTLAGPHPELARVVNPVPKPAPAHAPAPQSPMTFEDKEMLTQIAPQLNTLCDMAASGTDPIEVAEMVMEMIPDQYDEQLFMLVSSEKFVKRLAMFNKRVLDHAEFFEKLRQNILAGYSADEDIPPIATN